MRRLNYSVVLVAVFSVLVWAGALAALAWSAR